MATEHVIYAHDDNLSAVEHMFMLAKPEDTVIIKYEGCNPNGILDDLIRKLGYSYCGSQSFLTRVACKGFVTWQTEENMPFPNRTYPGKWPVAGRPHPVPQGRFYTPEEWAAEKAKRPTLIIAPKGCAEFP